MNHKESVEYLSNPALLSSAVFDSKAREAIRTLVKDSKDHVTAHWIEHNKKNYECSNCHNEDGLHSTYPTKYCYDCGATMSEPIEQSGK